MNHPLKLLTIICESLASPAVRGMLAECGARGFTEFNVRGAGNQGSREGETDDFANVQIEVVVSDPVATEITRRLEEEFFSRFALIVYETDIRVLRKNKF